MLDSMVRNAGRSMFMLVMSCAVLGVVGTANALEIIREVEPDAKRMAEQQVMMGQFPNDILDQWLFNGQAKFSTARGLLAKKLDAKLKSMDRFCKVTEEQRRKLRLAGSGDIHEFMRECDELQRGFDPKDQNQVNNIWQELQPLRNQWNGDMFGNDSMFARVQTNILTDDQVDVIATRRKEMREFAIETSIRRVVVELDQSSPLTANNREALTELLIKHIDPPVSMDSAQQKQMVTQYVLYACNEVPDDDVKELLDEDGYRIFRQAIRNCRGLKQHFKQMGMIE